MRVVWPANGLWTPNLAQQWDCYSLGHDNNLAAWEEEAAEQLPDLCFNYSDQGDCHLVGQAMCVYMRFTKGNRAIIKPEPFENAHPVTMQRVHRNNTPRRKK